MDKKEAKNRIKALVEKYEQEKVAGRLKKYTEQETKNVFIEPLFEALGWNFREKSEVSAEENISGDRVDYGFYLNDRIKFYLEAKKISADLNKSEFANQAIKYSWNKGVTWAVLSDFESTKVFNAQVTNEYLSDKRFFTILCEEYIEKFDQLWWLSKESFENNVFDKEAERVGKKLQMVSVSALLYKDLNQCRDILTNAFAPWNKNIDSDQLDEGVQKVLDRLIFIRVAEDRGIEKETLLPLLREWEAYKDAPPLYQTMEAKFRELDETYNSNLFAKHSSDSWKEYSNAVQEVITILYGKTGYYEYDFKVMPSYILCTFY